MYYQIKEKLTPCSADEVFNSKPGDPPYVVVMDPKTWYWTKEQFDMVIDIEMDPLEVLETIVPISARLIANKASYKFKTALIDTLVAELGAQLEAKV